jgi:hypothetical protein
LFKPSRQLGQGGIQAIAQGCRVHGQGGVMIRPRCCSRSSRPWVVRGCFSKRTGLDGLGRGAMEAGLKMRNPPGCASLRGVGGIVASNCKVLVVI